MNTYSFLRNFAFALKVIGYIGLASTSILIILLFNPQISSVLLSAWVIAAALGSLLSLFITSALITLLCDIADNTRRSADALENNVR